MSKMRFCPSVRRCDPRTRRGRRLAPALGFLVCAALFLTGPVFADERAEFSLEWRDLPALPNAVGLGGHFAGSHGETLIVAGGANFPGAPPWEGGEKQWHADIYVLESPDALWSTGYELSHPLAYGASVSTEDGLLLIGGCDGNTTYDEVTLLQWDAAARTIVRESLPPLPFPSAYLSAARIGEVVYVAAGHRSIDPTSAAKGFWSLDISKPPAERSWRTLPPWPGAARAKAVMVAQSSGEKQKAIYLFSGETARTSDDGEVELDYLSEVLRYKPATNLEDTAWTRLPDLPRPIAAGSAVALGQSHILLFSGSTGQHVTKPVQERPEFPRDILAYHTITDTLVKAGDMPQSVVTTEAVLWRGGVVIPSGEIRPGVRTSRVQLAQPLPSQPSFGSINYAVLTLYLSILVATGIYFSRRGHGTRDFFLAGGRIPWWAAGLSIYATQLSAITFIAAPALAFATDWVTLPAKLMITAMAPIVVIFYLPFFRRLNITSAYEYLERRFNLAVRLFGSASFIAFQIGRMAIVLYLPALALSAITGINIYACILIMGILSTLYTVLGGMEAVIWTDVIQVFVLTGGMFVGIVVIMLEAGGPVAVFQTAFDDGKLNSVNWTWDHTSLATWSILLGTFMLQFGPYTTDQAVIQRYLTTKDERAAAKGIWFNGALAFPVNFLFFLLGTCLYVFYKSKPELLSVGMPNDQIFPLFVSRQLPAGVSGLVIAGVFAASMSSLDSSIHSVATAVTVDFYRRFRREVTDRRCLVFARMTTVVVGGAATFAAWLLAGYDIKSLAFFFDSVLGLLTSSLAGVFILGIFTRRCNAAGALTGAAASFAILIYVSKFTATHFYLYAVIGITSCVAVGYASSLLFPRMQKDLSGLTSIR